MASQEDEGWTSEKSCQKVRNSCREWMADHQALVQIQASALTTLARDILSQQQHSIEWDEEQWHYQPSAKLSPKIALERLALYILAMDAINFCFWPSHGADANPNNFEYQHLAMAMAQMAQQDEEAQAASDKLSPDYIYAPSRLASLSTAEMTRLFDKSLASLGGNNKQITALDNMETRCQLWNQVGKVLVEHWEGNILKFLDWQDENNKCGLSAPQLVDRIVENFAGFRDYHYDKNTKPARLHLYKRAQICVGDWNASLQLYLEGLDQVTTFADYRVPQLLRHFGLLEYGSDLSRRIDQEEEILAASLEEKTIRAATVVAVEDLVQELYRQQKETPAVETPQVTFTAVKVDWYLWQLGEKMHNEGTLKPHHRTRTTFY